MHYRKHPFGGHKVPFQISSWQGWFLFGIIPLYIKQLSVKTI
jgi:hypothetical protein